MFNEIIRQAKSVNQMSERMRFYAEKRRKDLIKCQQIIKRRTIRAKLLRKLAGFTAGETMFTDYKNRIEHYAQTANIYQLNVEVDLRNLVDKGFAVNENGSLILTAKGEQMLEPYAKTTCMFTGRRCSGEF